MKQVDVTQRIEVTIDETKFNEAFLSEFRDSFYDFHSTDDHIKHLAQMTARGIMNGFSSSEFVDGYGPIGEMGIKTSVVPYYQEEEIV